MKDDGSPLLFSGPVGQLEGRLYAPRGRASLRAVVAHPHPLCGGTMDNVVTRLVAEELRAVGGVVLRFNFRSVGRSEGAHDDGRGEIDDFVAASRFLAARHPRLDAWCAGYSFGAAVMLRAAGDRKLTASVRLLALAPPITHYDFDFLHELRNPLALVCGGSDPLTPGDELRRQSASWASLVSSEQLPHIGHDLGTQLGDGGPLSAALERSIRALR